MRIYIACGLTHVPRDQFPNHVEFIHSLAGALATGHQVKYALVNSDPQLASKPAAKRARLCYLWDRGMVEEADLVIAEASFPSIGLGIELQIAQQHGTPIIIAYRDVQANKAPDIEYVNPDSTHHHLQIGEGFVTLMALGIPEVVRVVPYSNDDEGIKDVLAAVTMVER